MKVLKAAVIVIVLTFSSALWAQDVNKASLNFDASQAATVRCTMRQQASSGLWDLTVLVKDSSNHVIFNYVYSVHPSVKQSMNDCHAWMKAVNKEVAKRTEGKQSGGQGGQ